MTIAVDLGRKATKQTNKNKEVAVVVAAVVVVVVGVVIVVVVVVVAPTKKSCWPPKLLLWLEVLVCSIQLRYENKFFSKFAQFWCSYGFDSIKVGILFYCRKMCGDHFYNEKY